MNVSSYEVSESRVARLALVGVVAGVDPLVALKPRRIHKRLAAEVAGVAFGPRVRPRVPVQIVSVRKGTTALHLRVV